jgi:hypothetical protein
MVRRVDAAREKLHHLRRAFTAHVHRLEEQTSLEGSNFRVNVSVRTCYSKGLIGEVMFEQPLDAFDQLCIDGRSIGVCGRARRSEPRQKFELCLPARERIDVDLLALCSKSLAARPNQYSRRPP